MKKKGQPERKARSYKGKHIRLTVDLSAETLRRRGDWGSIFNNLEGKIKSFRNKQVLRDFFTTRPALQELLKALYTERNNQYDPF